MEYKCKVKELPTHRTISVRKRTTVKDLPNFLGNAYKSIINYLEQLGEHPVGPAYAAYYNEDMQNLDTEAGVPINKRLQEKDDIKNSEIPGGNYASCIFIGPYTNISPVYDALSEFIKEKGYEATGTVFELYLNDPRETPPEKLKTKVLYQLK